MKVKVGGTVCIRRDLEIDEDYGNVRFMPQKQEILKEMGFCGVVKYIDSVGDFILEGKMFWLSPEMLETKTIDYDYLTEIEE